jgi:hypothetical protein
MMMMKASTTNHNHNQYLPLAVKNAIVAVYDKEAPPKLTDDEPNKKQERDYHIVPQDHDVQDTLPLHCGTKGSVSPFES